MSGTNGANFQNLQLVFENGDWAGVGDAGGLQGSTVPGSLFVSLHSADPGETGDQSTNEITVGEYGQYARVAVARSGAAWVIVPADPVTVANVNAVTYAEMTTGTGVTATHFGIGVALSGATALLYFGSLNNSLIINVGITPVFGPGLLKVTMD